MLIGYVGLGIPKFSDMKERDLFELDGRELVWEPTNEMWFMYRKKISDGEDEPVTSDNLHEDKNRKNLSVDGRVC